MKKIVTDKSEGKNISGLKTPFAPPPSWHTSSSEGGDEDVLHNNTKPYIKGSIKWKKSDALDLVVG